jgi:hypothetical protein
MADLETLTALVNTRMKRAKQAKIELQNLADGLPTGWEKIPHVSQVAHEAHFDLIEARRELADTQFSMQYGQIN